MTTPIQDIPLNKLVPATCNVRRTGRTTGIEELAASINAHGLLQNLTVRPSAESKKGQFEVIAGGRRLAALRLLAKRKSWAKNAPIPCHVVAEGAAEELSLAENIMQCPMHPADQYDAFAALHRDHGMNAEDIAARFGVTPAVVRQRLKLAAVSPKLIERYLADELTLDQLSAFAITDDHALQEKVWENLGWNDGREAILAALNPQAVPASDPRVIFVGLDAYEAAGGVTIRDLFDEGEGGFLSDPHLLDALVRDRLQTHADAVTAEGWKWVHLAPRFDHGEAATMRRVYPQPATLTDAQQAELDTLEARYTELAEDDEAGEAASATLEKLETQIAALTGENIYSPETLAKAGAIVTLGPNGALRIERGFIRPEDDERSTRSKAKTATGEARDEGDPSALLPDRLVAELTSHRTAALRNELALNPDLALTATVHALAAATFFAHADQATCLHLTPRHTDLGGHVSGIDATPAMQAIAARQEAWAKRLPETVDGLWAFVVGLPDEDRRALLAHCTGLTIDTVRVKRGVNDGRHAHADTLATALALDMRGYWTATAETYFGRVAKERILEAVRDGVSPQAADNLANLKKAAMATAATERLAGSGWLPSLLRTAA